MSIDNDAAVLVMHQRSGIGPCPCGRHGLGTSWALHVAAELDADRRRRAARLSRPENIYEEQ